MTTIPGASRYLNTVTLANRGQGSTYTPSVLGGGASDSASLLDAGRDALGNTGIGLSATSRSYIKQFLSASSSGTNAIFGMSTVKSSSIENIIQQINAIRSSLPDSQIAPSLRGKEFDEEL